MIGDFWKGIGGRLAERWATALFSPAFVFWVGGLLAWLLRAEAPEGDWKSRLLAFGRELQGQPLLVQGIYVVAPLILVTLSGLALRQASFPVLRLLEGYWPAALDAVADRLRARLSDRADRRATRLRALAAVASTALTPRQLTERARLERHLRRVPAQRAQRRPTRLGNTLGAAESRPRARYGLDPVVCWPRLWLLLPDTARQEATAAYTSLLVTVQVFVCGLLFTVWTVWSWWALPAGLLVAAVAHLRMYYAAMALGDVLEACFDVHRRLLYQAVCWPLPKNPMDERTEGPRLTTYLSTGSRRAEPTFADPV